LTWLSLALALLATSVGGAEPDAALIAKGQQLYSDKKCGVCHAIKGKGGTAGPARGPDLSDVGAKRDPRWLIAFMKDPKSLNPGSKMMPYKGSQEELEALVAYLTSLR
jgi:mono/diheme cytochrome c family protein